MHLMTALLVSSISQAKAYIADPSNEHKMRYCVLVAQKGDTFEGEGSLALYHVSYPHTQPGRGWGAPVLDEQPYKTTSSMAFDELLNFLDISDLNVKQGWLPAEEEEEHT